MQDQLPLTTAKIVGGHDDAVWAQVATLQPFSYTEDNNLSELIAVVELSRNDSEDAAFFGKAILDGLQNTYFAKQADTIPQALERALVHAAEMVQQEKERLIFACVLVCVIKDGQIYFGRIGDGAIALFRNGQLQSLATGKSHAIIVGQLRPHDYLILGTNSFFEHAYPTQELFNGTNDAHEIVDILSPLLLSLPENGDIAAFIIAGSANQIQMAAPMVMQPDHPAQADQNQTTNPLPSSGTADHPLATMPAQQSGDVGTGIIVRVPNLLKRKMPILYIFREKKTHQIPFAVAPKTLTQKIAMTKGPFVKLLILLITISLIVAGIVGFLHIRKQQQKAKASGLYIQAQQLVSQAQAIDTTNTPQAQKYIDQAKQVMNQAAKTDPTVQLPAALAQAINDEETKLVAITAIQDPQTLIDLHLIKDGFVASKLVFIDGTFLAIDATTPTILSLDKDKHGGRIASGGTKLPKFISATAINDKIVALSQDGLYSIDSQTGDTKQIVAKDQLWDTITDVTSYNGNIYLLDGAKGQIWKYEGKGNSFGTIQNVVDSDKTQPLVGAKRLLVDGIFWVESGNQISRVSRGSSNPYTISGAPGLLGSSLSIASALDNPNLYILDGQNQRIIVASKDGRYLNQYTSSTFRDVIDIALNAKDNKLYLLTNSKVLVIPLSS